MSKPKPEKFEVPVLTDEMLNRLSKMPPPPPKEKGREPENPLAALLDNLFDKQGVVDIPEDDEPVDPWKGQ